MEIHKTEVYKQTKLVKG